MLCDLAEKNSHSRSCNGGGYARELISSIYLADCKTLQFYISSLIYNPGITEEENIARQQMFLRRTEEGALGEGIYNGIHLIICQLPVMVNLELENNFYILTARKEQQKNVTTKRTCIYIYEKGAKR